MEYCKYGPSDWIRLRSHWHTHTGTAKMKIRENSLHMVLQQQFSYRLSSTVFCCLHCFAVLHEIFKFSLVLWHALLDIVVPNLAPRMLTLNQNITPWFQSMFHYWSNALQLLMENYQIWRQVIISHHANETQQILRVYCHLLKDMLNDNLNPEKDCTFFITIYERWKLVKLFHEMWYYSTKREVLEMWYYSMKCDIIPWNVNSTKCDTIPRCDIIPQNVILIQLLPVFTWNFLHPNNDAIKNPLFHSGFGVVKWRFIRFTNIESCEHSLRPTLPPQRRHVVKRPICHRMETLPGPWGNHLVHT